ncbi:MAG: TRAP transporter TatT component family protein [bacterium]
MKRHSIPIVLFLAISFVSACSPKRIAVNAVGDMLADGGSIYESDDDIYLVGDALPFSLKLLESLLIESPDHRGLLLSASRGFVLYSYAYVHWQAEQVKYSSIQKARELRERAQRLYLRGLRYGLHALALSNPGFEQALTDDPQQAVMQFSKSSAERNVPYLYWSAAALGLAISVSKNEPKLLARLPEVEAMLDHALTLDEDWNRGTLHEFKILWAAAQRSPTNQGLLRQHYERALTLSGGLRASLYVSMAEAVSLANQDREEFTSLLEAALAVNLEDDPEHRLLNAIAQRRAKWLLESIDELIL